MTPLAPEAQKLVAEQRASNELPSPEPLFRFAEGFSFLEEDDHVGPVSPVLVIGVPLLASIIGVLLTVSIFFDITKVFGS